MDGIESILLGGVLRIVEQNIHSLKCFSIGYFLFIGMLAGTEGIGRIEFNDPSNAQFLGIIALIFILFSGGLNTPIDL